MPALMMRKNIVLGASVLSVVSLSCSADVEGLKMNMLRFGFLGRSSDGVQAQRAPLLRAHVDTAEHTPVVTYTHTGLMPSQNGARSTHATNERPSARTRPSRAESHMCGSHLEGVDLIMCLNPSISRERAQMIIYQEEMRLKRHYDSVTHQQKLKGRDHIRKQRAVFDYHRNHNPMFRGERIDTDDSLVNETMEVMGLSRASAIEFLRGQKEMELNIRGQPTPTSSSNVRSPAVPATGMQSISAVGSSLGSLRRNTATRRAVDATA